jgi:hypothetical protein
VFTTDMSAIRRNRAFSLMAIVVATLSVLAFTGCAAESAEQARTTSSSPSASTSAATFIGPITSVKRYEGGQVTLGVPGPSDHPVVDWTDALANCGKDIACGVGGDPPTISLALVTITHGDGDGHGHPRPPYRDKLSYVMEFDNVPCVSGGGYVKGGENSLVHENCTVLSVVDASNGIAGFTLEGGDLGNS